MDMLVTSLVMLAAGPLLVRLCRGRTQILRALDTFVLVTIAGLVLLHLVPESVVLAGWWALVVAVLGLVIPMVTHRAAHRSSEQGIGWLLVIAFVGLMAHAFTDGIALSGGHGGDDAAEHGGALLALGVVLHRLPMGMAVWWIVEPRRGAVAAGVTLLSIMLATLGGFFTGGHALGSSAAALGFVQALVAGSLLHVVQHHAPSVDDGARSWSGPVAGAVAGVGVLVGLSVAHPATQHLGLFAQPWLWLLTDIVAAVGLAVLLLVTSRRGHAHRHGAHDR